MQYSQKFVYPRSSFSRFIQNEIHYTGEQTAISLPGFLSYTSQDNLVPTNYFFRITIQSALLQNEMSTLQKSLSMDRQVVSLLNSTFSMLTPSHGQAYFDAVTFYIPCNYLDHLYANQPLFIQLQQQVPGFMGTVPDTVDKQNSIISWLSRVPLAQNYSSMGGLKQRQSCSNISVSCIRTPQDNDYWYVDEVYDSLTGQSFQQANYLIKTQNITQNLLVFNLSESEVKFVGDGNGYLINRPVSVMSSQDTTITIASQLFSQYYAQFLVQKQGSLLFTNLSIVTNSLDLVPSNITCQVNDLGCWRYGLGLPFSYNVDSNVCQLTLDGVKLYVAQEQYNKFMIFVNDTSLKMNDPQANGNYSYLVKLSKADSSPQITIFDYFRSEGFCMTNSSIIVDDPKYTTHLQDVMQASKMMARHANSTNFKIQPSEYQAHHQWKNTLAITIPIIVVFIVIIMLGLSFLYVKFSNSRHKKISIMDSQNIMNADKNLMTKDKSNQSMDNKIKSYKPKDPKESDSGSTIDKNQILQKIQNLVEEIKSQKLQILEQIGRGGYGIVYKALWNHELVAVKEILLTNETKLQDHAILEAAISFSLKHMNLVTCKAYSVQILKSESEPEYFQISNIEQQQELVKLYLIQEYCDYGTLTTHIQQKTFMDTTTQTPNLNHILQIALDIALGCQYIHLNNVIHGDLKSTNVLLQSSDNQQGFVAKLADFGLSVRLKGQQSVVSGHVAGTPFYIAPEVVSHGRISKQSDVFSFGVLLWELLNSQVVYSQHESENNEAFPQLDAKCPLGLAMLVGLCINPKDVDRPRFYEIINYLKTLKEQSIKGNIQFGHHNVQENLDFVESSSIITNKVMREWLNRITNKIAALKPIVSLDQFSPTSIASDRIKSTNIPKQQQNSINSSQNSNPRSYDQNCDFLKSLNNNNLNKGITSNLNHTQNRLKINLQNYNAQNKNGSLSTPSIKLYSSNNVFSYQLDVKSIQPARSDGPSQGSIMALDKSNIMEKAQYKFNQIHNQQSSCNGQSDHSLNNIRVKNLYESQHSINEYGQQIDSTRSGDVMLELILLYNETTQKLDFFWKAFRAYSE